MTDRTKAPRIKDAVEFDLKLKPYEKFTLDNGVPVYSINAGAEDVLMVELVFFAGNSYEQKNIIAAAVNGLLKNGTSTKTAFQINNHFEYYGAYLSRNCYNETATLTLHTLSKHLDKLLPVMQEIVADSVFPEEEISIFKQNCKQKLAVGLKKCDFVAGRLIDAYLFGEEHPYGKYSNAEDYDALQRTDLQDFYKKQYSNGNCIIFTAGKIPPELEKLLNEFFGKLPLQPPPIETEKFIIKPAAEKKYRIHNDPDGVQGAIRIASPFPNRHHPDFLKANVLNILFGGFFGSRLMSNIREDKGYTYGIHSYLQNHVHSSAWVISTEAGKDVCEATIQEVYNEMKDLREELVDDEELMLVRNYMMGIILGDLDGPFQLIARWKNIILNNLDEAYFYNSIQTIKTVTAEELKELATNYLQPEKFYELVVI
ncbi:MAG: insulinase family protein [Sphingobacteriales bacterium]|nr:insulinase family protein [Sphingobacteriales bacterium]